MSTFNKGEVVSLSDSSEEQYIILECIQKEDIEYLLLSPTQGIVDENQQLMANANIDHTKLIIVSFNNSTGEFKFNNNKEIIRELLEKIIGEE